MIKKGISFYFFSDEITCSDLDLFKENGLKNLLDAKRDTIKQQVCISESTDIQPDKPFSAFMLNQLLQYLIFQKAYHNFVTLLHGNKKYN
jgi:hypothetical protein